MAGRNPKTRAVHRSTGLPGDVESVLNRAKPFPEEEPDEGDRQALRQAREDVQSGDCVPLDDLLNDLDGRRSAAG